jgi:release factor glutamine methyltransferase
LRQQSCDQGVRVILRHMTRIQPTQPLPNDSPVVRRAKRLALEQDKVESHFVSFFDLELFAAPEVFCPVYGEGSALLAHAITAAVTRDDRVLDVGTGSGALALLAARQGARATGVDIAPLAVRCAEANAYRNGLAARAHFLVSDLFAALPSEARYSLIVFNPPFLNGRPTSWFERTLFDPAHAALLRFTSQVRQFLAPGGTALVAFSSAGDCDLLTGSAKRFGLAIRLLRMVRGEFDFFLYELRPGCQRGTE